MNLIEIVRVFYKDVDDTRRMECIECGEEFDAKDGEFVLNIDGSKGEVFSPCCGRMAEEVEL